MPPTFDTGTCMLWWLVLLLEETVLDPGIIRDAPFVECPTEGNEFVEGWELTRLLVNAALAVGVDDRLACPAVDGRDEVEERPELLLFC